MQSSITYTVLFNSVETIIMYRDYPLYLIFLVNVLP